MVASHVDHVRPFRVNICEKLAIALGLVGIFCVVGQLSWARMPIDVLCHADVPTEDEDIAAEVL
jgi:hypothetical protein